MYRYRFVISFSLIFLLIGCQTVMSEDEFLNNTSFESHIIDLEFIDNESFDTFSSSYDFKNPDFNVVNYSMINNTIEDYEHFEPTQELNLPFESNSNKSYVLIPVLSTWIIQDINLGYSYSNEDLTISLSTQISNFPATSIKLVMIEIESDYDYNIVVSLNE